MRNSNASLVWFRSLRIRMNANAAATVKERRFSAA
jgi:hypothetical protein